MTSRFNFVFWGLMFAFFRISIGNFDILPDLVGYVLISIGCAGLARISPRFTMVQVFCGVLAVLSVMPGWFIRERVPGQEHLAELMQCGLMWFLMGGVMVFAATHQRPDLARRAEILMRVGLGLSVFLMIFGWGFPTVGNGFFNTVMGLAAVAVFIVLILALLLIRRVSRELAALVPYERELSWWPSVLCLSSGLAALGVGIFFVTSSTGYQSSTFSGANFHAKDPQGCEVVFSDLKKLLDAKGFSSSYAPTEMDRFSGMHSADARDIWLQSERGEFKGIYLRISRSPSSIAISTKWEHDGFKWDASRTQRRAYQVSLEIARWFHSRPEKGDMPAEIEDSGIRYFEKSLADLPME
ncbi:MAG: hypothetical protein ABIT37_19235 [Luteolibacter sp.]